MQTMFEELSLAERECLSILACDGTMNDLPEGVPRLADEQILSAYRLMLLARQADEWAVSLNRQGRMAVLGTLMQGKLLDMQRELFKLTETLQQTLDAK